jgi:hypothetical protein
MSSQPSAFIHRTVSCPRPILASECHKERTLKMMMMMMMVTIIKINPDPTNAVVFPENLKFAACSLLQS